MGTNVDTYDLVIGVGHPATSLEDVVIYPDADRECELEQPTDGSRSYRH
ncbi:hypothetical protein [Natrialba swarupiae]|nr:hypothetical protein [Natrialba swarupiae]